MGILRISSTLLLLLLHIFLFMIIVFHRWPPGTHAHLEQFKIGSSCIQILPSIRRLSLTPHLFKFHAARLFCERVIVIIATET